MKVKVVKSLPRLDSEGKVVYPLNMYRLGAQMLEQIQKNETPMTRKQLVAGGYLDAEHIRNADAKTGLIPGIEPIHDYVVELV